MTQIDTIKEYKIYSVGSSKRKHGFIIHNSNKEFSEGHTHIDNYKTAIYLVNLAIHQSIPHHLYPYFLISLSRITEDPIYKDKLISLYETKKLNEKKKYYNPHLKSFKNGRR